MNILTAIPRTIWKGWKIVIKIIIYILETISGNLPDKRK